VTHVAVGVAREDGDRGVLFAFGVLAAQVVLERAVSTTEQPEMVPTTVPRVCAQIGKVRRGGYHEVEILFQVPGDAVVTINPHRAHRTGSGLLLAIHQVIDHQRPAGAGEQLTQANRVRRAVSGVQ
jgi:hypothetical protein